MRCGVANLCRAEPGLPLSKPYVSEFTAFIDRLLAELAFLPRRKQLAGTLSGGWKQRLSLACATAHRKKLLLTRTPRRSNLSQEE